MAVCDIDHYLDVRAIGLRRVSLAASAVWLRFLLRYLHLSRRVPTDLSPQVIGPMLYAYEDVPSILDRSQLDMVLTATGRRQNAKGGCATTLFC